MTGISRIQAETRASWHSFLRQRTAMFFTFGFPLLLVAIFGVIVETDPTGGGIFARPVGYYVSGYLAVVVLFTPLSRIGSSVARYRDRRQFEKLATTPLSGAEWLAAHTIVNTAIILLSSGLILLAMLLLTDAQISLSVLLLPFIVGAVVVFVGLGAVIGRIADSRDGVVAASNSIALPLLFLSDTFVSPALLPGWGQRLIELSPLTYFSRGLRQAIYYQGQASTDLLILFGFALLFFVLGAVAVPQPD